MKTSSFNLVLTTLFKLLICFIVEPCDKTVNIDDILFLSYDSVMTEIQSKLSVYKLLLLLNMITCISWGSLTFKAKV